MRHAPFCSDPFSYRRRLTREVKVGKVGVGGHHPIRVQSMITCDTMDTEASIRQTMELAAVGCEIVRITAPTVKDAQNLRSIKKGLLERGCDVPIVADIHFKPEAAMEAALWVEKVRINPGNYADSKKFAVKEYNDEQYTAELDRIRERFSPLVRLSRERGISLRIGTNHGSLSDRIMNRYGDTPLGMVESALEFARIARDLQFHDFIFSMKASNPKVMIAAYRLLVARLIEAGPDWNYPVHLGVTEAGDGEDGRIKSAIGIGSLLADGIGDTVRVSLTEDSVHEIPVAQALVAEYNQRPSDPERRRADRIAALSFDPFTYERRPTTQIEVNGIGVGGEETIRVIVRQQTFDSIAHKLNKMGDFQPEGVLESANLAVVDPTDSAAIAELNSSAEPRFVTVKDDFDLACYHGLPFAGGSFRCSASDFAEGHLFSFLRSEPRFSENASRIGDKSWGVALRRDWRCDPGAGRISSRASPFAWPTIFCRQPEPESSKRTMLRAHPADGHCLICRRPPRGSGPPPTTSKG